MDQQTTCTCSCKTLVGVYLTIHTCLLLRLGLPELAMGWLPLRFGIGGRKKIFRDVIYMY